MFLKITFFLENVRVALGKAGLWTKRHTSQHWDYMLLKKSFMKCLKLNVFAIFNTFSK